MNKCLFKTPVLHLLAILCFAFSAAGQAVVVDSLKMLLAEDQSVENRIDLLFKINRFYRDVNTDSVKHYLSIADPLIESLGENSEYRQKYHLVNALLQRDLGNMEAHLDALLKAEVLAEKDNSWGNLLKIKAKLTGALLDVRKYDEAIQKGIESLKLEESNPNPKQRAVTLSDMAYTYHKVHQLEKAEEYFDEAISIYKELRDTVNVVNQMANKTVVIGKRKGSKAAFEANKAALQYGGNVIRPYTRSKLNKDLGMTAVLMGESDTAYYYINKAIDIAQSIKNERLETENRLVQCLIFSKTGRCKKTISLLDELMIKAVASKNSRWQQMILQLKTDCQINLKDFEAATGTFKKRLKIQDSIFKDKVAFAVGDAEAKYETEKKEAEIVKLSLEDKLNQSRIKQQNIVLTISILGLGILSFLLYRLFGQKKKIQAQNLIISTALSEKDILLKEIHHRVKNNLQVISSLLRIQSNQTDDEVAVDALRDSQSRVQSMSLIHQDLYQHDNLTGINMKDYLEKLTRSLFDTYNVSENRIKLKTDIEDISLDVDTVVPLGLIINELVTNALKYAFPNEQSGQVDVSLSSKDNHLLLSVKDNGIGMIRSVEDKGFGSGLIQAFVNKLDAQLSSSSNEGTEVNLQIPKT